jgi:DHA3 family macrolide efflux protein-like MFS transporter
MDATMPATPAQTMTGVDANSNWKPRFFAIWLGQAFSLIGSSLTQFVLMWWITQTTGSASALATAGIMAMLPQALLGPIGGTIADRLPRRLIMITADSITALCMGVMIVLFATNSIQLWHIYTLMFIRSSMQAFQQPAAAASTAMLVPQEWLSRVAGMNQALFGVMTIAGAPLGAVALAVLPLQGALMIDVVTALIGITPLLIFAIPQVRQLPAEQLSVWGDFKAGVRYVSSRRGLVIMFGVLALVVFTVMPTFSLTPLLVKQHFNGGVNQVAFMEALAGIGIIAGGVLISVLNVTKHRIAVFLISFAISCFTVTLTALAPGNLLVLGAFWWFVSGVTFATGNAPMTAILQTTVPNQMQGRVLSLMNTTMGFAGPLGLLIGGPLGESIGVQGVFIIGGTLSALVCVLALFSRDLRNVEHAAPTQPPPPDFA